jgi:hypothetical protein
MLTMRSLIIICTLIIFANNLAAQPLQYAPQPTRIIKKFSDGAGGLQNSTQKTLFYNAAGHLEATMTERWENNAWVRDKRELVSPAPHGDPTQITRYGWTGVIWQEQEREYFTYDSDGRELTWLKDVLSGSNWISVARKTSTYNAAGQPLSTLLEDGNWSQPFNYGYEITRQYDTNGNMIDLRSRTFQIGSFEYQSHLIQTFDAQNRLKGTERESKQGTDPWKWIGKAQYTYNAENLVSYIKVFAWDNVTNNWRWPEIEDQGFTYTSDSTVMVLNPNGVFQHVRSVEYFNAADQKTKSIGQNWDNGAQRLITNTIEERTYTPEGAYATYYYTQRLQGVMTPQVQELYEYQAFVSTDVPAINAEIVVYPNPTADWLHIQVTDATDTTTPMWCTVYDLSGRIIERSRLIEGSNMRSLAHCPAGIYVARVEQGQAVRTLQIVRQ